jgi:hypothetical protein
MKHAIATTDPDTFSIQDDRETYSKEEILNSVKEISQERIKTFLREPSIEPEEEGGELFSSKTKVESQTFTGKNTSPIAVLPKQKYSPKTYVSLGKWEGYVIDSYDNFFLARITDLKEEHGDEEVEIFFDEISDDERKLVRPGAIFYWSIGYEKEKGTVKRSSIIRFRRLPKWTKSDIDKAKKIKSELENFLNVPK